MKKIKTEIIQIQPVDDGLFDDNICPICGHDIKNIVPYQREEEKFLNKIYYREATLRCPECKTKFNKQIIDKKVWFKRKIKLVNIMGMLSTFSLVGIIPSFNLSLEMDHIIFVGVDLIAFAIFSILWAVCWVRDNS